MRTAANPHVYAQFIAAAIGQKRRQGPGFRAAAVPMKCAPAAAYVYAYLPGDFTQDERSCDLYERHLFAQVEPYKPGCRVAESGIAVLIEGRPQIPLGFISATLLSYGQVVPLMKPTEPLFGVPWQVPLTSTLPVELALIVAWLSTQTA